MRFMLRRRKGSHIPEGLMLKLKFQYFGQLIQELTHGKTKTKTKKPLMLGKIEGRRRRG